MPSILPSTIPTDKPLNVELARQDDAQEIYDLLAQLYSENGMFTRSPERTMATIMRATERQGGLIGVIRVGGDIVGTVGMFISQHWYTDDHHLEEFWNFVHPDHRCTTFAKDLINFAKWTNENLGIPLLMGIISTERTKAKVGLYGRVLTPVGAYFMNGLPHGAGPLVRDFIGHDSVGQTDPAGAYGG